MSLYLGSEKVENVTAQITLPVEPSDDLPLVDGTASAGTSKKFSRADHVHPMETVEATLVDLPSAEELGAIPAPTSGTAGQVLTKTASGQKWADVPVDENSVLLKNVSTAMPVVADWNVITYGGGKFVALAANSAIGAYSTDGFHWTQVTLPVSSNWSGIAYGADKFVATGDNRVSMYSADGISWTQTALPSDFPTGAYNIGYLDNDGFYAVGPGTSSYFGYSADGITWEFARYSSSITNSLTIACGMGIAVTSNYSFVVTLRRGRWDLPNNLGYTQNINAKTMSYGNNKFVAISGGETASNHVAYSGDTYNWNFSVMPVSAKWYSSCYGNGLFVAIASESNIAAYSIDGVNWNQTTLPVSANWRSIAYDGYKFIAIASNSSTIAVSYDGIIWKTAPTILQYSNQMNITSDIKHIMSLPTLNSDTFFCVIYNSVYNYGKYICDKKFNDILSAYTSGRTCIAILQQAENIIGQCKIYYLSAIQNTADSKTHIPATTSITFVSIYNGNYNTISINNSNQITVTTIENAITPRATKITLSISGWDSTAKTQSVTVTGVSSNATSQEIRVMPADASKTSAYVSCGVSCVAQASNKLTFACDTVPTTAIDVYVVMQSLNFQS